MEEKITLCGDNCIACPRYNAHSKEELEQVAKLWYRVGWRDRIVSADEIACGGCSFISSVPMDWLHVLRNIR